MSRNNKIPQSINLLLPVNSPEDVWDKMYDWLFNVGKYILILVQVVVLAVFFARFTVDRKNNDLTEEVNSLVSTLSDPFYTIGEIKYNSYHTLFDDLNYIATVQTENDDELTSKKVASVKESIPSYLELQTYSYNNGRISLSFLAVDFKDVQKYETLLSKNSNYDQNSISVNLRKEGDTSADIEFNVSFIFAVDAEELDL